MSHTFNLKPWDWTLLILKPWSRQRTQLLVKTEKQKSSLACWTNRWVTCVGVMWLMSSEANCLSSVVFPPLSRPSSSIRTSWSGVLFSLRRMESNPCHDKQNEYVKLTRNWLAWCYIGGSRMRTPSSTLAERPEMKPFNMRAIDRAATVGALATETSSTRKIPI